MKKLVYILIISLMAIAGCTKPYTPASTTTNYNYLVVEGIINTGTDSTIIKLSRTVTVGSATTAKPETKATLTVENMQGTVFSLNEIVTGTYAHTPLTLDNTQQYRLRIKTSNGNTYLSDFVVAKVAPPIDSVGFTVKRTGLPGLQIYVNAHDPTNNTRYYKYTYSETWQFHSFIQTGYISNGTALLVRTQAQNIFYCFGNDSSANVTINSTIALSKDMEYQFPLTEIDSTSEKIETKYSIYVTQFALTQEAYQFWNNLRTNTEQLGSIFDAQPSQLEGNIHNIADAAEPVVGYISAGTLQKKRIYITKAMLPPTWQPTYPYSCPLDTSMDSPPPCSPYPRTEPTLIDLPIHGLALSPITIMTPGCPPPGPGWVYTSIPCSDCTIRGRVQQPAFWK